MDVDLNSLKLLGKGKVKDIYEWGPKELLFVFSDRVSAYDVILPSLIPRKGEVLAAFASYFFSTLSLPNHMVQRVDRNKMIVKKLQMIRMECIVRGYMYGGLLERYHVNPMGLRSGLQKAEILDEPIFDPTTKSDKDVPITKAEAVKTVVTNEEYEFLRVKSLGLYRELSQHSEKADFIMADIKIEFGKDDDGKIILADSIGPDEFRLWPRAKYQIGSLQESFDKQPVRDWLSSIGYKTKLDNALKIGSPVPEPPILPQELIALVSGRYVEAYRRITGLTL